MKNTLMVVVAAVLMLSAAPALPVFAADLSAKVTAAKTAADHEALADEYTAEAKAADARAAEHDKMAASYKGLGKTGQTHETHCAAIAKRERENAKELNALAAAHRADAKAAK
jgi:hypothetical protein